MQWAAIFDSDVQVYQADGLPPATSPHRYLRNPCQRHSRSVYQIPKRTCSVGAVDNGISVLDLFNDFPDHAVCTVRCRVDRHELVLPRWRHLLELMGESLEHRDVQENCPC